MPSPKDLSDFCSMGTPSPPNEWSYKLWEGAWDRGNIGITGHPVLRDSNESRISLDLPPTCWVMEEYHPDEFHHLGLSHIYVRESFVRLARLIIALFGGPMSDD
jgi:hypothetical protein